MIARTIVIALVTFFHDLFTVVWIGGMIVTVISYMPAVNDALGTGPQVKKVMIAFQKRQSIWVYISMVGLILTGLMMSNRSSEFEHLFGFGNGFSIALSIKHIFVILLIVLTLYRSFILRRNQTGTIPNYDRLSRQILIVNAVLALAVLLTSGIIAALS